MVGYESTVIVGGVESSVTVVVFVNVVNASVTVSASVYFPSGAIVPSPSVPSQVRVCGPTPSGPLIGVATTSAPLRTCSATDVAARVSMNDSEAAPCDAAEKSVDEGT